MNLDYKNLLPQNFSPSSRVWIYQCNRLFSQHEALQVEEMLNEFTAAWKSHGDTVTGYAGLFFGRFIIVMADESHTGVSGCSTDSSVRLMKQVEEKVGVTLFDRQLLAFVTGEKITLLPLHELTNAIDNNVIDAHSLYFNNTVLTKAELVSNWIIPVKQSWLGKRFSTAV
jgi:hypothetical protein